MQSSKQTVVVYLVTFRRHAMLRRALLSVVRQTHRDLRVRVVNDDPNDCAVQDIIEDVADDRVSLFEPLEKRGATINFNLMFSDGDADFVSLLEDDNWWEPGFLETMLAIFQSHPQAEICVGNERIWKEQVDGTWTDTGVTVWQHRNLHIHEHKLADLCGSSLLCNSAMLVRNVEASRFRTPDTIPVDVTEHFRERLFNGEFLLNGAVLVNYAETLSTARSSQDGTWGLYQPLLIGSTFAALAPQARKRFAAGLWSSTSGTTSPRAVTLVMTGIHVREARSLLWSAPARAILRSALSLLRRPATFFRTRRRIHDQKDEFDFLREAPLTRRLAQAYCSSEMTGA